MIYAETQKFKQAWLWIIVILSCLIPLGVVGYGFYSQIVRGEPFGTNPTSDTGLMVGSALIVFFTLSLCILFGTVRLNTMIDEEGISYRFYPFHIRFRVIRWEVIEKVEVIKYHPIADYGGWGIRYGKGGRAYNVSGDRGLRLDLKNGKHLMLGTQKEEELKGFLLNFRGRSQ
jgi:hypothetical protein